MLLSTAKERQIFHMRGKGKSFLRNLSSICNEMFEEWIPVRSAMTEGHYVQHGLLNSSLCRLFKRARPLWLLNKNCRWRTVSVTFLKWCSKEELRNMACLFWNHTSCGITGLDHMFTAHQAKCWLISFKPSLVCG